MRSPFYKPLDVRTPEQRKDAALRRIAENLRRKYPHMTAESVKKLSESVYRARMAKDG